EPGRAAAVRAFELSRALGNAGLPGSIYQIALVLAVQRETDTAARLAGFADGYADKHELGGFDIDIAIRSRLVERLHNSMSPDECQAAMAEGAAWSELEAAAAAETVNAANSRNFRRNLSFQEAVPPSTSAILRSKSNVTPSLALIATGGGGRALPHTA